MFDNFDIRTSNIFKKAEKERYELSHPYVGSEHLLLALLSENNDLTKVLNKYDLTYKRFKEELISVVGESNKKLEINLYTPLLKKIIENAITMAKDEKEAKVTPLHLFMSMLEEGEGIAIRLLIGMGIELEEIYNELSNINKIKNNSELLKVGIVLNDNVDMNEKVIGRDKEIMMLIETLLRKQKNNPMLTGSAGVGKTALVEELARRIERKEVPTELYGKQIISINVGSLVAGTKYRGEFEEKLNKIINEVINRDDVILFIDEIHSISNAGGAEGAVNASDILKPYLARGKFKLIGSTTTEEYNKYIKKDKALERRFIEIKLNEPDMEKTKDILKGIKNVYEDFHHITISDDTINTLVELANRYLPYKANPDKSIDLLDSICARVKVNNKVKEQINSYQNELNLVLEKKHTSVKNGEYNNALKEKQKEMNLKKKIKSLIDVKTHTITEEDILSVLEDKTKIPLLINRDDLLNELALKLNSSIFGQDKQITKIMNKLNKSFMNKKTLSFLLCGPTGVGKTETVKLISEVLTNNQLLRLDMSEYVSEISVNKLIGVAQGYIGYDDEPIFNKVRENPFMVILLDEIEKSSPKVMNLLLQILDEGYITNSKGEKIDFSNTIIFMTSNIQNSNKVGFNNSSNDELANFLSKELIGRIDCIVNYNSLLEEDIRSYLNSKNVANIDDIIELSEFQKYGLRNIKRLIKE
ncbi:MAG: ATP-dependent Clp protease ATP-binding subunit [Bacilli bacterium]|nr:ATP-dependent Clp protease ATP-binding subunit [Bacilli bacterium]